MLITGIEVWRENLQLSEPYTIAYETYTQAETVFTRIETQTGIVGYGAATPDEHVTGEQAQDVERTFQEQLMPVLLHSDPLRYGKSLEDMTIQAPHSPSARALADMALYDLLGKITGVPAWKLLGGFRDRIETSVTVGILTPEQTIARIKELLNSHFSIIKLKGGIDAEADIRTLHLIAEHFGSSVRLRFDANQGYTQAETLHVISHLPAGLRLEFIEQPVAASAFTQLGIVTKASSIPIMADESMDSTDSAYHLIRNDLVDMINIKLMKSGGITGALQINSLARAGGVGVMVGCMDECELGISAALHVVLSQPNIQCADLDGFMDLVDDPSAGCLQLEKGYLYPSQAPGLGMLRDL
ncbi:MAG: mandelate racemase/muconate lactonizing enzyme family protein [Spirochaetota bacterium]